MRYRIKQWFAVLLALMMTLTTLPVTALAESVTPTEETKVEQVQTMIDVLPETEEITTETRDDVQAQIDAIDAAMLELTEDQAAALDTARYDAAVAALLALDDPTGDNGMEANTDPDPEPITPEQVQAMIDALPEAEEITAENRADVQAQIDAIDAAMLELTEDQAAALDTARYDAAAAALLALDAPSVLEQVQALIDALPDADTITADNRADVEAQLTAIDEAKQDLTDDELDELDVARYLAAVEAILALDDMAGADGPETMDTDLNVGNEPVNIDTGGNYTITGSTTSNTITVNGGDVTITLKNVSVTSNGGCAFDIQSGNVTLILEDGTTNSFTSAGNYAGIHVAENAHLIIRGNGALNAVSEYRGAGIGGNQKSAAGHITIESGTITAKSKADGAGIGGGHTNQNSTGGSFQSITITGGKVTAESGGNGAGIGGGCWCNSLGTITISGGVIHAKTAGTTNTASPTGNKQYDIGYGYGSKTSGSITITGGVIFTEGSRNRSIGGSSVTKNNCIIFPNSGSVECNGNPTITGDITIPSGKTLTVPNGSTLTVETGATLTVASGATLTNNGTVQNNGSIINYGTINGNIDGNLPASYTISVTSTVFANVQEGYEPEAKTITIKNTGNKTVTISKVTVSGSDFTIINGSENTLAVGESNTSWKIQPNTRLAVGKHTATVTVFYDGGATATASVSIEVADGPVKYLDEHGDEQVRNSNQYTILKGQETWDSGWYVLKSNNTIENRITVSGDVHLILTDGCTLTANGGIGVGGDDSLTIYGQSGQTGTLSAVAKDQFSAGIGGGQWGSGGNITINGGNITADSGEYGAGIGGGWYGAGGNITINGGTVVAIGGRGACIGGGYLSAGGTITISGGNVTATSCWEDGIGHADGGGGGSFSTGENGHAVIHAKGISDTSQRDNWSGIIFEGNSGAVYGDQTLSGNFEVKSNETLTVRDGASLTVADEVTLTNNGTIYVGRQDGMDATLNNEGTITNNNLIDVWGQLTNGEIGIQNQGSGRIVYHFNLDVKAPTFEEAKYGYSQPLAKEITIINNGEVNATITDVKLEGEDFTLNIGDNTTVATGNSDTSWTIQPVEGLSVGIHTATISVTYSGSGGTPRTATAEVSFTVTQATPTVDVNVSGTLIYGSEITLTTNVTASGVDSGEIDDNVTFKAGAEVLDTVKAENGTATLTIKADNRELQHKLFGTDGNVTVTAAYAGDSNIKDGTGTESVTIKPKTLTFDFHATDRTYDTTTEVEGNFTLTGVVGSDDVNVSTYTVSADSADAGTQTVTAEVTKLGGDDTRYYEIGTVNGGTVDITQAILDLTISEVSIIYGEKLTDDLLDRSTAKITGIETPITGTWAWAIKDQSPDVSDSDSTQYEVVFIPTLPEKATNFTAESLSKEITVTVKEAESSVIKDPAPNNTTYDGEDHLLVEAGTAQGGTMQYSLEEYGKYTDTIPTGRDANTYTVWYKVAGDANHTDTVPESVTVIIGKAEGTGTLTMEDFTCKETGVEPEATSDTNGTNVTFYYAERGTENFTDKKPDTAGFYTVKAEFPGNQNYNELILTADFKITHQFNAAWEHQPDGDHRQCACGTQLLLETKELNEVPEGLLQYTVDEIKQVLAEEVDTGGHYAIYDVELEAWIDGEWVIITPENLPDEGVAVTIPYPVGTNERYPFTVVHMFTTAGDGHVPGDTEVLETTNGPDGIHFTVKSFSPIIIGWKTGNLTVTVTDTGEGAGPAQQWQFRVELDDKTIDGTFGDMEFTAGVAEFTLQSGQSLTAKDLPEGVGYTVTELNGNQNGYTTTYTDDSGFITSEQDMVAAFVNDKPAQAKPDKPSDDPDTPTDNPPDTPTDNPPDTPTSNNPNDTPKTGDESHLALWFSLIIVSLLGITVIILTPIIGRKKLVSTNGRHMRK